MITILILIPLICSFLATLFLLPFWIRKANQIGLVWTDMNKHSKSQVAGSGGIIVLVGFMIGLFSYIAYLVFYLGLTDGILLKIFALAIVVLFTSMLGFIDDLLGWQQGGLSKRSRIILVLFACLPLVAINAGISVVSVPFFGLVNLGLIYPLLIIPVGIVGATTTFNFLAGFNGLEAGNGIIIISAISVIAYYTGNPWLSIISLCMVASLIAFLFYNISPAQVFPGDSLTYGVGSLIAVLAIIGNFEKIAVFFFIPVIIEVFLKSRGGLVKHSFGQPNSDGSLSLKYPEIYSLNHAAIYFMQKLGIKPTEMKVVLSLWGFQILIILLGFLIFHNGIF